jgi:hypothetical protein
MVTSWFLVKQMGLLKAKQNIRNPNKNSGELRDLGRGSPSF